MIDGAAVEHKTRPKRLVLGLPNIDRVALPEHACYVTAKPGNALVTIVNACHWHCSGKPRWFQARHTPNEVKQSRIRKCDGGHEETVEWARTVAIYLVMLADQHIG